jgi:small subunit ribosomal protein S13
MAEPQAPQTGKPAAPAAPVAPAAPKQPELKYLVRIVNTDLDGKKSIAFTLSKVKGVGIPFAFAACRIAKVDVSKKAGALSDAELKKIEEVIRDPIKAGMPAWMVNRRYDYETGQNKHLLSGDLQFTIDNDIKMMKKMKCYKGVRHILGQPVRGQRTRSNFRRNKGKVMGVRRSSGAKSASGGTT